MWTRRISSQTQEHPAPQNIFRQLLCRLIENGSESSWAHFEVVNPGGWFKNLLRGKEPWIEVAYVNQESLELNPGISKSKHLPMPAIPEKWRSARKRRWLERKREWIVPLADVEELTGWIDECLRTVSGNPDYRVTGWLEGL